MKRLPLVAFLVLASLCTCSDDSVQRIPPEPTVYENPDPDIVIVPEQPVYRVGDPIHVAVTNMKTHSVDVWQGPAAHTDMWMGDHWSGTGVEGGIVPVELPSGETYVKSVLPVSSPGVYREMFYIRIESAGPTGPEIFFSAHWTVTP